MTAPTNKKMYALRLDVELLQGLRAIKARVGIPESEQIRRAIQAWLAQYETPSPKRGRRRTPRAR
jgi:predicted DNA-binding protein